MTGRERFELHARVAPRAEPTLHGPRQQNQGVVRIGRCQHGRHAVRLFWWHPDDRVSVTGRAGTRQPLCPVCSSPLFQTTQLAYGSWLEVVFPLDA